MISHMTLRRLAASLSVAALLASAPMAAKAQQAPAIDNDDIGGVVTGPKGPEAGVWVIAETRDLRRALYPHCGDG